MYIVSKNKKFNIQMPQALYNGEDLRNQIQYVHIYLIEGKEATICDLSMAVRDCFASYEIDYRNWAPELHIFVHANEKEFKLEVNWEVESWDYIVRVANQFKL